jgi:hypothetical protein
LARQKIRWEAFREVFEASVEGSYNEALKEWRGYFLMAIDGSRVALPREEGLRRYYGAMGEGLKAPTAQASLLYDITNDIIVDANIGPLREDERTMAKGHLKRLRGGKFKGRKVVVLMDRGYPSKEILKLLRCNKIGYVMRVAKGFNKRIDEMDVGSERVTLGKGKGLRVRAVVFTLKSGEREALITNLGEAEVETEAFAWLYYQRWPIETKYNQVKQKMELENFSGRLVDHIKQDFYAMMTVSNMLASALRTANEAAAEEREGKGLRYEYRANVNHAVGVLKDRFIKIMMTEDADMRDFLYEDLLRDVKRRVAPVRPNRQAPRKEKIPKPHFHHNHKSNC